MEEREISLKELFNVVWKGKIIIVAAAIIFFMIALVGAMIYEGKTSKVATVISLQWEGITRGEYPNGTRFDHSNTIQPYTITLAIEESGLDDLLVSDVRKNINIEPIVANNIAELIEVALREGEELTFFPTEFKITMNNGALGLSVAESRKLLTEIIKQYRLDFERKFISQHVIMDFTDTDFSVLDFVEIHTILETQATIIEQIMNDRVQVDSGFVSSSLGIGFGDILVRTSLIRQIELAQISSRTTTFLLTRDKEFRITNYLYQIELKELELAKAEDNVVDAQLMIDNFSGSVNTIIIPGMDPAQILEIETYYNVLLGSLVELNLQVSELTNDIAHLQLRIDRLEGNDPNFVVTPQRMASEILRVEEAIDSADMKLDDIIEDANTLLREFNEFTTSHTIRPLMVPTHEPDISKVMVSAIGLVLGAGIGTVFVLFRHDWTPKKEQE